MDQSAATSATDTALAGRYFKAVQWQEPGSALPYLHDFFLGNASRTPIWNRTWIVVQSWQRVRVRGRGKQGNRCSMRYDFERVSKLCRDIGLSARSGDQRVEVDLGDGTILEFLNAE